MSELSGDLTVTVNRAYPVICFGETLWDMLPSGKRPGGAPMNVAYHLNHLGVSTAIAGRVGKDILGGELLKWMQDRRIPVHLIQQDEENKTGKVIPHVQGNHISYDIVKPAAWDAIAFEDELLKQVKQAEYFVFGSLAARGTVSRKTLYRLLKASSLNVFDINLREPYFNEKRIEYLLKEADIVKVNDSELDIISSWYADSLNERKQMKNLQDLFGIRTIITTRGERGAVILDGEDWFEVSGFRVDVKDTIGSGDAFLAGWLYQTILGKNPAEKLSFACALGAVVASYEGACPDYAIGDIEQVMHGKNEN